MTELHFQYRTYCQVPMSRLLLVDAGLKFDVLSAKQNNKQPYFQRTNTLTIVCFWNLKTSSTSLSESVQHNFFVTLSPNCFTQFSHFKHDVQFELLSSPSRPCSWLPATKIVINQSLILIVPRAQPLLQCTQDASWGGISLGLLTKSSTTNSATGSSCTGVLVSTVVLFCTENSMLTTIRRFFLHPIRIIPIKQVNN